MEVERRHGDSYPPSFLDVITITRHRQTSAWNATATVTNDPPSFLNVITAGLDSASLQPVRQHGHILGNTSEWHGRGFFLPLKGICPHSPTH